MNLEESNNIYQKNKQNNAKKQTILGGIVICVIIMVLCIIGIMFLNSQENNKFKAFVNGQRIEFNPNFIVEEENGQKYLNIKLLADYTGYKYTQGDYIEVNEDKNSCYLENDYEIVTFKADENTFSKYVKNNYSIESTSQEQEIEENEEQQTKYVVKSEDGTKENFTIETPIKLINDQLYIPINIVHLACNATVSLTDIQIQINSIDYLVQYGQNVAAQQGYTTISSTYENLRAISNNMLILGNDNEYGVMSLIDGKLILSVRYDDIIYVQNENKFYVYIDSKVGIVDAEGNTIISPTEYNSIETFDLDKNLYLVQKDGKYGILNSSGELILHTEFDAIGIDDIDKFNLDELENENLWFDTIIAVKKGEKYGLYDIEKGNLLTEYIYDGFGYQTTLSDKAGEESLLIVPPETGIKGIVVNIGGAYGIYNIDDPDKGIPSSCTRIYCVTNNGVSTYYMEFNEMQLEMSEYFKSHDMVTVN